jgi:hypothetical protein
MTAAGRKGPMMRNHERGQGSSWTVVPTEEEEKEEEEEEDGVRVLTASGKRSNCEDHGIPTPQHL